MTEKSIVHCSFCGAYPCDRKLLMGPSDDGSYICDACVLQCMQIIIARLPDPDKPKDKKAKPRTKGVKEAKR